MFVLCSAPSELYVTVRKRIGVFHRAWEPNYLGTWKSTIYTNSQVGQVLVHQCTVFNIHIKHHDICIHIDKYCRFDGWLNFGVTLFQKKSSYPNIILICMGSTNMAVMTFLFPCNNPIVPLHGCLWNYIQNALVQLHDLNIVFSRENGFTLASNNFRNGWFVTDCLLRKVNLSLICQIYLLLCYPCICYLACLAKNPSKFSDSTL